MNIAKKLRWKSRNEWRPNDVYCRTHFGEYCIADIHGTIKALRRHVWDNDCQDDVIGCYASYELAKEGVQKHLDTLIASITLKSAMKGRATHDQT